MNSKNMVTRAGQRSPGGIAQPQAAHDHVYFGRHREGVLESPFAGNLVEVCPTGVFTFGNLMDKTSRVRQLVDDPRAYQVMGYLNTKPAVIYLKKVNQKV